MASQFRSAAPRQNGNHRKQGVEAAAGEEIGPGERWSNPANQRMTDEFHRNSSIAEELLFERKNAKRQREAAPHNAHPPGPPGPELRTNVINVAHAERFQLARQPQMESGKVGDDSELGPPLACRGNQMPHGANQLR